MKVITEISEQTKLINSCITLGKFDGVHLGHRRLFTVMQEFKTLSSVIFTFDTGEGAPFQQKDLIYGKEEKECLFHRLNPDYLIYYPFTAREASMEAEVFIRDVLIGQLDAKAIVIGDDYCFGYQREGNYHLLEKLQGKYGYDLSVQEKVMYRGTEISSSRIRNCLKQCNFYEANEMLGEPYFIYGISGDGFEDGNIPITIAAEKMRLSEKQYLCRVNMNDDWVEGKLNVNEQKEYTLELPHLFFIHYNFDKNPVIILPYEQDNNYTIPIN